MKLKFTKKSTEVRNAEVLAFLDKNTVMDGSDYVPNERCMMIVGHERRKYVVRLTKEDDDNYILTYSNGQTVNMLTERMLQSIVVYTYPRRIGSTPNGDAR